MAQPRTTDHVRRFVWTHRLLVTALIAAGIVASVLELSILGALVPMLEGLSGPGNTAIPFPLNALSHILSAFPLPRQVQIIALVLLIGTILKGIFTYIASVCSTRLQNAFLKYYRMLCFDRLLAAPIDSIHKTRLGHLQTLVMIHVYNVASVVSILAATVPKLFTAVLLLGTLFLLSWKTTLIALAIFTFGSIPLRKVSRHAERAGKGMVTFDKGVSRVLTDTLSGMKVVRLFNRETYMRARFEEEVDSFNANLRRMSLLKSSVQPMFETFGVLSISLVLFVGSVLVLGDGRGLGVLLTFLLVSFRLMAPAQMVNQAVVSVAGISPYFRELVEFVDAHESKEHTTGSKVFSSFRESLVFEHVGFSYGTGPRVIADVSFHVPRGSKVGIVGISGSGKSTLVELLLRFYDPQEGRIAIDGIDLRELNLASWRQHIGVVTQDTFVFHDTVMANIGYALPSATREMIIAAAKRAYAHDFISVLPQGYDTSIGERGVLLSGGQRQRIAIARAILANPEILVFDEATSALDAESEKIVQDAIEKVAEGKTVITIAHRLSTLMNCDRILVLNQHGGVEEGTPEDHVRRGGLYAKLLAMQRLETPAYETPAHVS